MLALTITVDTFWSGFVLGVLAGIALIVLLALMYGDRP